MKTHMGDVAVLKHKPRAVYWDQHERGVLWLEPGRQYLVSHLRQLYAPLRAHYERQRGARGQLRMPTWEELRSLLAGG
jgi:hypothetical protein